MYQASDFLARNVAVYPDRLAVVAEGIELTYAQLYERAKNVAKAFSAHGISRGDVVAYLMGNTVEHAVLLQAIMLLGAVALPLNKRLYADDVAYMMEFTKTSALVYDKDKQSEVKDAFQKIGFSGLSVLCEETESLDGSLLWSEFEKSGESAPEVKLDGYAGPDDLAYVLFTSGTTGRPKAVMKTAEMVWMLATGQLVEGHSQSSAVPVVYTQSPMFHMGGFLTMLKLMALAGTLVLESHFKPWRIFQLIEQYSVNQLYMIPPALFSRLAKDLSRKDRTFPLVLEAQCAGGRTHLWDIEAIFSLFPNARLRLSYGSSEAGMATTSYFTQQDLEERPERALSIGRVNYFYQIVLVDPETDEPVSLGEPGEALIKSPMVFSGYMDRPEATEKAFTKDGYYRSGDLLKLDEDGCYTFVDRVCDMVKTGGENVYTGEVETVILDYPGIADVAVVGVPDARFGEAIGVAIVLEPGYEQEFSAAEMAAFVKSRLASFKKPRYYLVMDELPRNALAKVQRNKIRERFDEFTPIPKL